MQGVGRAHAPSSLTVARGRSPDPDIDCGSSGQVSGRRPAGSRRPRGTRWTRLGRRGLSRTPSLLMDLGRGRTTTRRRNPHGIRPVCGGFARGRVPFLDSVPLSDTRAAQSQSASSPGAGGSWDFSSLFSLNDLPWLTLGIKIVVVEVAAFPSASLLPPV